MTTPAPLVKYDVTEAQIAAVGAKCAAMSADTSKGYEEVRLAIADLRTTRVKIEKRRVELKADALAYGRLVDSEAKRFTDLIVAIEEPLQARKQVIDDEKERVKREAEEARQRDLEAKVRAEREAEEARLKAERDAEEARLAGERLRLDAERKALAEERRQADEAARVEREAVEAAQAAERERLEIDRAALAEERRAEEERQRAEGEALRAELKRNREADEATARAERDAIEQERRKVADEREQAERAEFERQARFRADADAVAKAAKDRLAEAEQGRRLATLKPDLEKVRAFAAAIRALPAPVARSKNGKEKIAIAVAALGAVAGALEQSAEGGLL